MTEGGDERIDPGTAFQQVGALVFDGFVLVRIWHGRHRYWRSILLPSVQDLQSPVELVVMYVLASLVVDDDIWLQSFALPGQTLRGPDFFCRHAQIAVRQASSSKATDLP